MEPDDLGRLVRTLPGEPPRRIDPDVVLTVAGRRRRRRTLTAVVATVAVVAGSVLAVGAVLPRAAQEQPLASPAARLVVDGRTFQRLQRVPFVLRPGVRERDPDGLHVTLPGTTDGPCATHYEAVVERETSRSVEIATWEYRLPPTGGGVRSCDGVGVQDREVRLQLAAPLGERRLWIAGVPGDRPVLLLARDAADDPTGADLAPADPAGLEVCLDGRCVEVADLGLRQLAAAAVNSGLPVRPGGACSDEGREHVDRTYVVTFRTPDAVGPRLLVPLGCTPMSVEGDDRRFLLDSGAADAVRIAHDQQISPQTQCLGIGGPSGGPPTKDYVGLTLAEAERRAQATDNDVVRIAGRDGTCVGLVRDHVINRVNVYLEDGVVTAAKSF